MPEILPDKPIKAPAWLIKLCTAIWNRRGTLFGTILGGIVLNIAGGLLLTSPSSWQTLPLAWLFVGWHWAISFGVLVGLAVLVWLSGLIARRGAPLSERDLQQHYLQQLFITTTQVTLKGVPQGPELIAPSIDLAEVFIEPVFYPARPLVDYPLAEHELAPYQASLADQKIYSSEAERILDDARKNWLSLSQEKKGERAALADVWTHLNEKRVAVIQGYPGMGKSTLLERLTLHFALRGLNKADPEMSQQEQLIPTCLPILLRLGEYANAYTKEPGLTLDAYLKGLLESQQLPGLTASLQRTLHNGAGLVMLDGLDEVSEPVMREQVQEQINTFIHQHISNRFLITSRVAGYNQEAFTAYPHFTLVELDEKQITAFLPRWCRANIRKEHQENTPEASVEREVNQRVSELQTAFAESPDMHELARNPLLLTLLLVMQQNSIVLPRQRAELYDVVTRTLLEQRNRAKRLPIVPEAQAIQRLGPLAFRMQEENNGLMRRHKVEEELVQTIQQEGGSNAEACVEMAHFLQQIRERGGLFVSRVGDDFGFMHHTFQEYFAARYILNQIMSEPGTWIEQLVTRASHLDDHWREPYLLAVAYQTNSGRDKKVADKLLQALLTQETHGSFEQKLHNTLLAATALHEAKEPEIRADLREQIVQELLICYEQAQYARDFSAREQIETHIQQWLLALPKEPHRRTPLLAVLTRTLGSPQHLALQRATLTLLAMIAQQLELCSEAVFETLIPPLLALTSLPAVGPYRPDPDLATSPDLDIIDLALAALLFLGKRGPSGLYLEEIRRYFEEQPVQLRLLARCSLTYNTLITPTMVPQASDNYRRYETALGDWARLRNLDRGQITGQNIATCQAIYQRLFACAEKVNYPASLHLLAMLQRTTAQDIQVWPAYLLEQLNTGSYIDYQEAARLWHTLFPIQPLLNQVLNHYTTTPLPRQRYAERMLASLTSYVKDMRDLADFRFLNAWIDIRYLNGLSDVRYVRYLSGLSDLASSSSIRDMSYTRYLRYLQYLNYQIYLTDSRYVSAPRLSGDLSNMRYLGDLTSTSDMSYFIYLRALKNGLLKQDTVAQAQKSIATTEGQQKRDLFAILQGRLLAFQIDKQRGQEVEEETQLLAETALEELAKMDTDEEVCEAALDVLRALPARTAPEIALLQQIANTNQDGQIQRACVIALQRAQPLDEAARGALEQVLTSPVQMLREMAQAVIKRKGTEP